MISDRVKRSRKWLLLPVGLVVSLAVAAVIVFPGDGQFTTSDGGRPAPLPSQVNGVAWQWQVPEDAWGVEVLSGNRGPVAVLHDGVIALNGEDGEEIWGLRVQEGEDTVNVSAGVTPDGNYSIVGHARGKEDDLSFHVTVMDTITGEVESKYSETISDLVSPQLATESRVPDLRNLSNHTWLEPSSEGFVAREISTGDISWEFEPDPECRMIAGSVETNLLDASVGSTGEAFLVPLACAQRGSAPENGPETAAGEILALDAATGEAKWASTKEIELRRSPSSLPGEFTIRFDVSPDGRSFVARTSNGRTLFDVETGEVLYEDLTDFFPAESIEYYFSIGQDSLAVNRNSARNERPLRLGVVELPGGRVTSETELPAEYYARTDPAYYSIRPADLGSVGAIPLAEGVLVLGCDYDCSSESVSGADSEGVLALFVPWGEVEVESVIELPGFTPERHYQHDGLLLVPGGVVAYQETGTSGFYEELIGLN